MVAKLVTFIAFAMLLTGVIVYSRSHISNTRSQARLKTGYTIKSNLTHNWTVYAEEVRYVKSNGEFLADTNYLKPDGSFDRNTKLAGTVDHGAVAIDDTNRKLKQEGRAVLLHDTTEAEIKALGFDREDSLLGYKVIVQR